MSVEGQIWEILKTKHITLKELHCLLKEKYNKTDSLQNLSSKIKRNSLKYIEVEEIADVLNYKIIWTDNEK